jgi:hypothetical protein
MPGAAETDDIFARWPACDMKNERRHAGQGERIMRNVIIAASLGFTLCGCTTDNQRVEKIAVANCNAVGITENDPQFATCRQAYGRQYIEDRLTHDYHDALTAIRQPKLPHNDPY